jgi:hypothetical protein
LNHSSRFSIVFNKFNIKIKLYEIQWRYCKTFRG